MKNNFMFKFNSENIGNNENNESGKEPKDHDKNEYQNRDEVKWIL